MKTRLLWWPALCAILCLAQPLEAQIRQISVITEEEKQGNNADTRLQLDQTGQESDFCLYREVVRKHSWYEGQGQPISQAVANRLPYYFRLSMRNAAGHWQRVQAMHQDTMTTRHLLSTYILDKRYDTDPANRAWREKLQSVAQWYLTASLDGKDLVEERAYTAQGDMVYSFQVVRLADGCVMGSYNDTWGFPADIRQDPASTYGSVVRITYDRQGRDSIIDYLDGKGYRKYNANGVDQQRCLYDQHDRLIQLTSHNLAGDYITDNWGNCGNRYTYDDAHRRYSIVRLNQALKPMRMPPGRAGNLQTFERCDVTLDRWGRDLEAVMLKADGRPDTTLVGVHRIVYHYDARGSLQSTDYFNLTGQRITPDAPAK